MFTMFQLLAHLVGDYLLQSDWMAATKTKSWWPALAHVATYSIPFLFLTTSWKALLFIAGTHFIIDHWRLARYVCWAKNWLAPRWFVYPVHTAADGMVSGPEVRNWPWKDCVATGYGPDKPAWMSVWLLIITDNTMHLLCNGFALTYLR